MKLPKIQQPIYEVYLKSLDRKVKFRPFLVKEEKLLIMAKMSDDFDEIKRSINGIMRNCCLEEDVNTDELPLFDLNMFMIHLRAKSVGEVIKLNFTCLNNVPADEAGETKKCMHVTQYQLNLDNIVYENDANSNIIDLGGGVGVKLYYPTFDVYSTINDDNDYEALMSLIKNNLECIFDENSVYPIDQVGEDELNEFMESLSVPHIKSMQDFFKNMPRVVLKDNINCEACGFNHVVDVEDIHSFFA